MIRHLIKIVWNRKRANFLIAVEIFLSFLVLFAVIAQAVYYTDNYRQPLGFSYDNVWNVGIDMKQVSDDYHSPEQVETVRQLYLAVREFEEVEAAAGAHTQLFPFGGSFGGLRVGEREIQYRRNEVTDDFDKVTGLTLARGRWFGKEDDGANWIPRVINQRFAREVFGDEDPVGKRIPFDEGPEMRVIGVVTDFRHGGEFAEVENVVFQRKNLNNPQERPPRNLLLKLRPDVTRAFEEKLATRLHAVAKGWSFEIKPVIELRDDAFQRRLIPIIVVGVVAALLLIMVMLGLTGVLWLNVTQRTKQDMNFSRTTTGAEGIELLKRLKARKPGLPVILITAWGSIDLAVQGMRSGASDFITKPWTRQQIIQAVDTALGLAAARLSIKHGQAPTRDDLDLHYDFGGLVGEDPKFLRALELIGRIAVTDASALITGESGVGKELIADAIHRNSHRRDNPFVKVNLGGVPAQLFESEMFGHVKGAFTDARADRKGRFETAGGGTIFLDEIGDLDASAQVKLLRVLQDRTYEPLGSSQTRTVDVRVISATNRNLAEMVSQGQFREDLLYRLNLIAIHLPSLRERASDIPLIAGRFIENLSKVYRRPDLTISDSATRWLQTQQWPGNVRQLRHTIERALLISDKDALGVEDFELAMEMDARDEGKDPLPQVGAMTLDDMERAMIIKAMRHYEGNISKVAEALGLSRAALYRRFEKYRIKT